MSKMPIKLVLGSITYLFSEGLKKLLEDDRDINVMGIFTEGIDLKEIVKLNPDVIIADFDIFRSFPEEFTVRNRLKILLMVDWTWLYSADKQIPKLVSKGVVGILPPGVDSDLLKKAIKAVSLGELWIDRKTIRDYLSSEGLPERKVILSEREKEIVSLICQGYRNKEIAHKLNISEQTVKSHCNRIYEKVGVSDRLQLALYSYKIWPDFIQGYKKVYKA
jgi:two-component system nitrate/nitrite response regulator NarL